MSISFNDTTDKRGLIQICETTLWGDGGYGKISNNTDRLKQFTSLLNDGLDRTVNKILGADTRWQFDDRNHSDNPVGLTDLVDDQRQYPFDYDILGLIKVTGVEYKHSDGNYYVVHPFDERDVQDRGIATSEFLDEKGLPRFYDLKGDSLYLYPAPDATQVTTTDGLKLYYQRGPSYFESDDTTKKPGIPSTFQKLPAYYACEEYAIGNLMSDKAQLIRERLIIGMEAELDESFSNRDKDSRARLTVRRRNAR